MAYNPQNPNGSATSLNSAPVVIASDQAAISVKQSTGSNLNTVSQLTDGTNTANVIAGNTGNAVQTAFTSASPTTFSITSATTSTVVDMANYSFVSIQITSQGTSSTVTPQWSNDNSTWVNGMMYGSTSNSVITSTSSTGIFTASKAGRYFRLSVTSISSGTTAGTMIPFVGTFGAGSVTSLQTTGSATNTTGTITTSSSSVTSSPLNSYNNLVPVTVHGTYAGVSFGITVSDDNGTTYYNAPIYDQTAGSWLAPGSTITPGTNASKVYWVTLLPNSSGALVKVLASAWTSGTANIKIGGSSTPLATGSTMSNIWDAGGNNRGAYVNASNQLSVSVDNSPTFNLFATSANYYSGTTSATGTTSTSIISGVTSNYLYVTSIHVANTSATAITIAIQNGSGGTTLDTIIAPAGGGANITYPTPMKVGTLGNGLYFAASSGVTTAYVTATAYAQTT